MDVPHKISPSISLTFHFQAPPLASSNNLAERIRLMSVPLSSGVSSVYALAIRDMQQTCKLGEGRGVDGGRH